MLRDGDSTTAAAPATAAAPSLLFRSLLLPLLEERPQRIQRSRDFIEVDARHTCSTASRSRRKAVHADGPMAA